MDKVLLVFPKTGLDKYAQLPLGLLSIASTLVDDYEVEIIDQRIDEKWAEKVELKSRDSICVGVTSMTGVQIANAIEISKIAKKHTKLIWGGVHPTLLPHQTLQNKYIDIIVLGEGEVTFPLLLKALKDPKRFEHIRGIGYKDSKGIHVNELRDFLDMNTVSNLPYHLLEIEKYLTKREGFKRCLSLETSRGCPHDCSFCSNPIIHKRLWSCLNVENLIQKTKYLQNRFKLDGIVYQEDNFFVNILRVKKFCEAIQKDINIGWKANCRISYLLNKDSAFLKMLEKGGCKVLQFGVESGTNRILKLVNKGITIEDILKVNSKLAKGDIICRYNFIVGIPTETQEEIQSTLDFIEKLQSENANLDTPFLNLYTPWPGTKLFDLSIEKGFKSPNTLDGWSKFNWNTWNLPWLDKKTSKVLEDVSIKYRNESKYFSWTI
ncbi:Radical SAM superfamily enzyme YgiQ, UPF0313 family [Candidatus Methanophagaceae archaeon]|nr:Radical SAM superfamily enzyme YgiQ, UPF0313 family [Methanophagales archaeon]